MRPFQIEFRLVLCTAILFSHFPSYCYSQIKSKEQAEQTSDAFKIQVDTEKKPWSHLNFHNDPDNFQFAIVSDRTGGVRKGVFPRALKKLNLLEPEFVITVGDLISGSRKTKNEAALHEMWDEMEKFVDYLEMPFFYLAGNHDNGSKLMSKVWKERFGVDRYHFVYKNVLFICMNSQDTEQYTAYIGDEQTAWVKKVLEENKDVRWTFIFIHQPVWMYEKGVPISEGNRTLPARKTGWKAVEKLLEGRKHTAFAGHIHQYIKFNTADPKKNYYTLGTTGAGSRLRGVPFGEFDHAMWVTMTDQGPKIANLLIDGILADDVNTEETEKFRGLVKTKGEITSLEPLTIRVSFSIDNQLNKKISGHYDWEIPPGSSWKAEPLFVEAELSANKKLEKTLLLTYTGEPKSFTPLPILHVDFRDDHGTHFAARNQANVDLEPYYIKHNIELPPYLKYLRSLQDKSKQLKKK